jgi:amyloid beta precursor protein binding protein 1
MATDNKYDRQLRLWGADGQKRLSEASILLINATAAGTETLKNLILPGVGFITILDDKLVEERDLGTNFFVTKDSIGKSRGETAKDLLLELNEDVKGHHLHEAPSKYISNQDSEFFSQYSLIIA